MPFGNFENTGSGWDFEKPKRADSCSGNQIENVRLLEKHVGDRFYGTDDFEVGDAVFVREGPLTGLRGVIERLDRKKLHIHVDAIPGSVMIDVEPHQVQLEKDTVYQLVTNRWFLRICLLKTVACFNPVHLVIKIKVLLDS